MRFPFSLHVRLGVLSIAMVLALFVMNIRAMIPVAEGMVVDKIDIPLDSYIRLLRRGVAPDGTFHREVLASAPELAIPWQGWGWDLRTPAGHWRYGPMPGVFSYPSPHFNNDAGIYSGNGYTTTGEAVHVRRLDTATSAGPVTIIVMSPRSDIERQLALIRRELYKVASEIVLVLVLASALQIRVGLYPLRKLVKDVARVRSGQAPTLPEPQPSDLQPLASEINALIARNNAGLEAARLHAANLAHAVKTPLASLMLQLEYEHAGKEAQALLAHISGRVAHHLHRARTATVGANGYLHCDIARIAQEVKATMALVDRSGRVDLAIDLPAPCIVAVDAEDFGEMLGNLVENACRYAGGHVVLSAESSDNQLAVTIEDDGPGIADDKLAAVLQPGVRLDEVGNGYGLGLAIVRELAELYGGALILSRSVALGGLRATLILPR